MAGDASSAPSTEGSPPFAVNAAFTEPAAFWSSAFRCMMEIPARVRSASNSSRNGPEYLIVHQGRPHVENTPNRTMAAGCFASTRAGKAKSSSFG